MTRLRPQSAREESTPEPRIDDLVPPAALPLGEVEIVGAHIGPHTFGPPVVVIGTHSAHVLMSKPERVAFRVPEQATTGLVEVRTPTGVSNAVPLSVARELTTGLHPVTSPVSVVRVSPDGRGTPFVTGILNATGLAFSPEGDLFVTSRAEGNVYRIDGAGESTLYAEGMGVATGAVFDTAGNLFVGDRSGTIFKIDPQRKIFVYATLEPSVSAYHLAVDRTGTLFVTGPTLSSNDAIWAIDTHGEARPWYRGLGRPQGLAIAKNGDICVTACLHGRRGLVQVTPDGEATLVVAGINLVGVAFSPLGTTVLATNEAVYDVDLGVEGMILS